MEPEMTATTLIVAGMTCAGCARKVEKALREIEGVRDVSLHYPDTVLGVLHDARISEAAIAETVQELGFTAGPTAGL